MNKRYLSLFSFVALLVLAAMACGGLQTPAEQPAAQPAPAENTSPEQPPAAPDVREDIPLMADAANVTAAETADGYSVSYNSASSVDDVTAFYQAEMPALGWVYKAEVSTVAGGVSAVLTFDKGDERAAVTLNSAGTGTQVIIGVAPAAANESAAAATEAPASEPTTAADSTAPDVREDIPLMADAANVTAAETADGYSVSYNSASSVDDVTAFYQAEMPALGWVYKAEVSTVAGGVSAVLAFDKGDERAAVTLNSTGAGTQVIIGVAPAAANESAAAATEAPASEPTAQPPAASTGLLTCQDIPLMADAAGIGTLTEGDDCVVSYTSASGMDAVVAFYQAEMPALGWTYNGSISSVVSGVNAVLYFTQNEQEAAVTITNLVMNVQVVVALEGGAAAAGDSGGDTGGGESTGSGAAGTCPGIPLMADAAGIGTVTEGDDCVVSYTSASGVDAVVSFYKGQMPGYGWTYNGNISSVAGGVSAVLYFTQGSQEAAVTVTNEGGVAKVVVAVEGGQ